MREDDAGLGRRIGDERERPIFIERADDAPSEPAPMEKKSAAPVGAAAGAIAGATAGLVTGPFGPLGALVGAIVGAIGGTAVGAAGAQGSSAGLEGYAGDDDVAYQDMWNDMPSRPDDRSFASMRPAFQFGHLAAQHPSFAGRDFANVEPELRAEWNESLEGRVGRWESVRPFVEAAYTTSRSRGVGVRRDTSVIGSAGSAVDPVELERSRAGLPSVEEPRRARADAEADRRRAAGDVDETDGGQEAEWRQQLWRNDQAEEGHGGSDAVA